MIPTYDELMLPVLKYLASGEETSLDQLTKAMISEFSLTEQEQAEQLPSGASTVIRNRVSWAKTYLVKAGTVETTKRAHYRITESGESLLAEGYEQLNKEILSQFPSFVEFISPGGKAISVEHHFDLENAEKELLAFQTQWPIGRLKEMSLEEYTNSDRASAFIYWLEALTNALGSIWGGSAYKFLIFRRANLASKIKEGKFKTDGVYSWIAKLGEDREEVFHSVREEVVRIATLAQAGNLEDIEPSLFGDVVCWKIAYLYNPELIIPIYKREMLDHISSRLGGQFDRHTSIADFQRYLLSNKPDEKQTIVFASELWNKYNDGQIYGVVEQFLEQAQMADELGTKGYPKTFHNLNLKVSFGKGTPAKVPWVAMTNEYNTLQKGIYPIYLYYKEEDVLVLTYGISEQEEPLVNWPVEVQKVSIKEYFETELQSLPFRYGSAYVYKVYPLGEPLSWSELQADVEHLISVYKQIDFSEANDEEEQEDDELKYWVIAAGSNGRLWEEWQNKSIISIGWDHLGDLSAYDTQEDIAEVLRLYENTSSSKSNDSKACFEFSRTLREGDYVFAKRGRTTILGYGRVVSGYIFDEDRVEHKHYRKVEWLDTGNWETEENLATKTLTNLTEYSEFIDYLLTLIGFQEGQEELSKTPYTKENLLQEVFIPETEIDRIIKLLKRKKNLILQGPPGTGKTFLARRLAYAFIEEKNEERVKLIQFHQSYAYEDFIQGYRPNEKGQFELVNGVFYRFCEQARKQPEQPYFFIIDEINRGNLSKIFGELMMLIEHDKRGEEYRIPLTYSPKGAAFDIPENLYLIGTMNTADRSLAMVDYALRRRFAFVDILPKFNDQFKAHLIAQQLPDELIHIICNKINGLNRIIEQETDLGKGFSIGHSYFCTVDAVGGYDEWYSMIIDAEIRPLLEEYWFDKPEKVMYEVDKLSI